jgi:hypothetical protein
LSPPHRGSPDPVASLPLDAPNLDEVVGELRRVLAGIQHGSVTLIVQDGRVVQIDATQKLRFTGPRNNTRR